MKSIRSGSFTAYEKFRDDGNRSVREAESVIYYIHALFLDSYSPRNKAQFLSLHCGQVSNDTYSRSMGKIYSVFTFLHKIQSMSTE